LHQLSESPLIRPEDRRVYRAIFDCATRPIDKLAEEDEQPQRRFAIIEGGNSAA
jgi:hypothetical protein